MPSFNRLAAVLAVAACVTAACDNPFATPRTAPQRRADETPAIGGMYGSGHDVITSGGTEVVPEDTTGRIGGMYGSGH
jgi:hypothetical protein